MIKIAHTADLHIYDKHKYSIDGSRLREIEANLICIVDYCILNSVDILVIAGDVFESYNPSENLQKVFSRMVKKAVDNKILVRVFIGNHDTNGVVSSLDSLRNYMSMDNSGNLIVYNKAGVYSEVIKNINLVYVPWANDLRYQVELAKTHKYDEHKNLMFTHGSCAGAYSNTGIRMKGDFAEKMELRPVDLIGWDYVGLGDFHKAQQVGNDSFMKKNKVYYSGSPNKLNWGEKDHLKGFNVITVDDEIDIEFVPLNDIEFIQVDIDYEDLSTIDYSELDVKNSFIKLFIKTDIKTKDVNIEVYKAREELLKAGARDVYITFKKENNTVDGKVSDEEGIELDFISACNLQLKSDKIKESEKFMEYIKCLQAEI